MSAQRRIQPLGDIAERVELLKTTLGLFAPGEPAPIADELRQLAEEILIHWLVAREQVPADAASDGNILAALLSHVLREDPGLVAADGPCRTILDLHAAVARDPEASDTVPRLVALATAVGDLYAVVVPHIGKAPGAGTSGAAATRIIPLVLAIIAAIGIFAFLAAPSAVAEEVSTRYRGLTLLGNLELVDGRGPEDGVAMIVHGLLAHDRMEIVADLQKNLKSRGVSSLAITLSLGQSARTGMFDCGTLHTHRPYDSLDEIDAWIGWLKNNGATDVVLIGHSQGGNQVAVYGVERRDPSVSGLVLLAPATFDFQRVADAYKARYEAELPPLLDKARAFVQAGQGVERLEGVGFLSCPNATVTAESFAGWYSPSPLRDTPTILPRVPVRTLVVVAGNDDVVPDLAEAAVPLARPAARNRPAITVRVVEGADHFFRDLYNEDAADVIADWIKG
jgi:pimeloyl-ACP methyl ester carboxylesterase